MCRLSSRLAICLIVSLAAGWFSSGPAVAETPNVVIIFADDQGYADVGCFGATGFETPNLDRMANEGTKFTNFYVAQAVCGASRAALLTGNYPNRIGLLGAPSHATKRGIHEREMTIAELLKQRDYRTAIFGKWHLGHHRPFLPLQNGFDEYYGLPYSNDMWPYHPTSKAFPELPMYEGNEIVDHDVNAEDQTHLTSSYTKRAVDFIDKSAGEPFFLYVAHSMPHVPLFCEPEFEGASEQGAYGDIIQEIDWSVGEILQALERNGIADDTLVIYTSDNGPWLSYGNHAGSAGPLREGKGTAWEGGVREPCIMRWPNRIPAGRDCGEMMMTIDILPTLAAITETQLPDHKIDGLNVLPVLLGEPDAQSPHEALFYYYGTELRAVRKGDWKLVFPHRYRSLKGEPGNDGMPGPYQQLQCGLELYNLRTDVGERSDVASEHPEVVKQLQALAESIREELGDSLVQRQGSGLRAPGRVE